MWKLLITVTTVIVQTHSLGFSAEDALRTTLLLYTPFKVPLAPKIFFKQINVRYCPDHFGKKVSGPGFLYWMLYLFKVRKLGGSLAHRRQCRRIDLAYFSMSSQGLIHTRNKHKEREKAFLFFFTECLIRVLLLGVTTRLVRGRALDKILFFFFIACSEWEKEKKMDRFYTLPLSRHVSWANKTLRWRHKVN